MTATATKIPDPLVVLRRAEQAHTGEEPADLGHLADAVRTLIIEPLIAGGVPPVDTTQVKQLLADKQRLEGILAESRELAVSRGKVVDRQQKDLAHLQKLLDEARIAVKQQQDDLDATRAERDTVAAQLRDRPTAGIDASVLDQAQRDNARLADELAMTRRSLELANRTLDEIADEQENAPEHRHEYLVPGPGEEAQACACGKENPRRVTVDGEEIVPDVEPWGDLFGRIRGQVAEGGGRSDRARTQADDPRIRAAAAQDDLLARTRHHRLQRTTGRLPPGLGDMPRLSYRELLGAPTRPVLRQPTRH